MEGVNMKNIIMKRLGCPEDRAILIEEKLNELQAELKPMLNQWLEDGSVDEEMIIEGYSVADFMRDYEMEFTGAILTLDWLLREPEKAKEAIAEGYI